MNADRMRKLEKAAARFDSDNHGSYIRESLQTLREPTVTDAEAPIAALRLLEKLQNSTYASRPDQKHALAAVGSWLESWLVSNPGITRSELAHDLGWLARLSKVHRASGPFRPNTSPRKFGQHLARIDALRRDALAAQNATSELQSPPAKSAEVASSSATPSISLDKVLACIQAGNAAQELPPLLERLDADTKRELAAALLRKFKRKWFATRAQRGVPWAEEILALVE